MKEANLGDILAHAINPPRYNYNLLRNQIIREQPREVLEVIDSLIEVDQSKVPLIKVLRHMVSWSIAESKFYYEERKRRLRAFSEAKVALGIAEKEAR